MFKKRNKIWLSAIEFQNGGKHLFNHIVKQIAKVKFILNSIFDVLSGSSSKREKKLLESVV